MKKKFSTIEVSVTGDKDGVYIKTKDSFFSIYMLSSLSDLLRFNIKEVSYVKEDGLAILLSYVGKEEIKKVILALHDEFISLVTEAPNDLNDNTNPATSTNKG